MPWTTIFFVVTQRSAGYECLPDGWQHHWNVGHEAWYFLEVPDGARPAPEAPLLVVLPVDDLRRCGLSSHDAEEARLAGAIGSVASDYLVPGIFPTIPEVLWADDWHFTEAGAKTFAKWPAQNLRKYLVSLARFKEGMLVNIVSDSTFDFLNWDNKRRWVGLCSTRHGDFPGCRRQHWLRSW